MNENHIISIHDIDMQQRKGKEIFSYHFYKSNKAEIISKATSSLQIVNATFSVNI